MSYVFLSQCCASLAGTNHTCNYLGSRVTSLLTQDFGGTFKVFQFPNIIIRCDCRYAFILTSFQLCVSFESFMERFTLLQHHKKGTRSITIMDPLFDTEDGTILGPNFKVLPPPPCFDECAFLNMLRNFSLSNGDT